MPFSFEPEEKMFSTELNRCRLDNWSILFVFARRNPIQLWETFLRAYEMLPVLLSTDYYLNGPKEVTSQKEGA